jgi:hypothetical protein
MPRRSASARVLAFVLAAVPVLLPAGGPAGAQGDQEPESIPARTIVQGTVTAPLDVSKGQPVVEARIDGKGPFRFFLDTGAGTTVLDGDLAKELGLAILDSTRLGDPVNPQAIRAGVVKLASIEIGAARFEGVRAVTWDRSTLRPGEGAPRGVLGIGVFHDVLLALDYPKSQLRLKTGMLPEADGARILAYRSPHGIPVIPVSVGGRTWDAHLDSGSPSTFNLPLAEKDSVRLLTEPTEVGRGRTANTELVIYGAQLADTMRLGGYAFPQAMIRFNDRLPHANLGGGVLREFVVTLDQKNRRVRFDRTGRPASPRPAPRTGAAADSAAGARR